MINIKRIAILVITCFLLGGCGAKKEECHDKCTIDNFYEVNDYM